MFKPQRLGTVTIPDAELTTDKKNCKKIGPCGVGEKAIYLNSFYLDRRYYIPISSIERIFKRIAMSKGGFTGKGAFEFVQKLEALLVQIQKTVKANEVNLLERVEKMVEALKENEREIESLKDKLTYVESSFLKENAEVINGTTVVLKAFKSKTADELRKFIDLGKEKMTNAVIVLASSMDDKVIFAAGVTKDTISKVKAGNLVKEAAQITGGNGGGRPDFAQAGGKDTTKVAEALEAVRETLRKSL